MRMPYPGLGPWVFCAVGILCGCSAGPDLGPRTALMSVPGQSTDGFVPITDVFVREASADEETSGDELILVVEGRARAMAEALELTEEEHAELLGILLHEADRLDAVREQASDPLMREAVEDHLQAVAEWRSRAIRRTLGPVLAERIAVHELAQAERIAIIPGGAGPNR